MADTQQQSTIKPKKLPYSCEEIYERMDNGMCIFCEEHDTPDHYQLKHKGVRIFVTECDDDLAHQVQKTVTNLEPIVETTQLHFSSPGGGCGNDSDDTSPSLPSLSRIKFPRKVASKRLPKKKKKNNKLASPMSNRIWNEEDELALLKGLVDYGAKTILQPTIDGDALHRFVGGYIHVKVSKEQLLSKIRKLKQKFLLHMERFNEGNDPQFTRSSDSEAFGFSMMIWGKNDAEYANAGMDKPQRSESEEDEELPNAQHLNDNGAAKSHPQVVVDKITDNGTAGEENYDDDELCAVRDAFETMMSQGLSDYQKKLHLKKLMNLGTGKARELSNEWKVLCAEETKLNIKKLRFCAKLAEAANDR